MNIAIFGGAFNPVHNGHVHLVKELCRANSVVDPFDKIILIPTANPPHKSSDGLISGEDRVNMLRLAFDGFDNVEISTIEFESEEKSYTYHTLKKLKKIYPNDDLNLLIGSDQLFNFNKWYKYDKILQMAHVHAITRKESERESVKEFLNSNKDNLLSNIAVLVAKPVVVSSTQVRNCIKNGDTITDLVPPSVEEYIKEHGLYV